MTNIMKLLVIGTAASVVMSVSAPVYAAEQNRQDCSVIHAKIDERIEKFNGHRNNFADKYQRIKERLNSIVEKLKQQGKDTTQLEVDINTFRDLVDQFKSKVDAVHTELSSLKDMECGSEMKEALHKVLALFKNARSDAQAVHDFYKNTLKPEIQALRGPKPSPIPSPSA